MAVVKRIGVGAIGALMLVRPAGAQISQISPTGRVGEALWSTSTVDRDAPYADSAQGGTSLAILPDGSPAIAYSGYPGVRYVAYEDGNWKRTIVFEDPPSGEASHCSLAILPSGYPAVSYAYWWCDPVGVCLQYGEYDGEEWQLACIDIGACGEEHCEHVGAYNSLAVYPSNHPDPTLAGQPMVSYYDASNRDLKFAWRTTSGWQKTTVDAGESGARVGQWTSLVVYPMDHPDTDLAGEPAISYYDESNGKLKYTEHDDVGWHTVVVNGSVSVDAGRYTSVVIISGQPAISFYDATNGDLKYVRRDGSGQWPLATTVDEAGDVGGYTSLAVLPSGNPAISYRDFSSNGLKYAWYEGGAWHVKPVNGQDHAGYWCSLAILPTGKPVISQYHIISGSVELRYTTLGAQTGDAVLPVAGRLVTRRRGRGKGDNAEKGISTIMACRSHGTRDE